MKLFSKREYEQLVINGNPANTGKDHRPVVKLYLAGSGGMVWLLTEIDYYEPHLAYGLYDLGYGMPEIGRVNLNDLKDMPKKYALPLEKDLRFKAFYPLSVYAAAADQLQYITDACNILVCFSCEKNGKKLCM